MRSSAVVPENSVMRQLRSLVLREHALGLLVYTSSAPERPGNAMLGLTLLICAVLWSTCDGVLPRAGSFRWATVLVEGMLLYVGSVAVTNLLRFAFGQMPVGW